MFKPVPMLRLRLVVLEKDERAVLRDLGRAGIMHLTRAAAGPDTAPLSPFDNGGNLARCDRILARLENLRHSLELPSPASRTGEPPEKSLDWAEAQMSWLEEQSASFLKRRQILMKQADQLTHAGQTVSDYRGWEIPLDDPGQFSFLHFVTGRLPAKNLEKLPPDDRAALLPLRARNGAQPVIVMTTRQRWLTLEGALRQAGFQPEPFPIIAGTNLDAYSEKQESDHTQITKELEDLDSKLRVRAMDWAGPLAEIESVVSVERRLLEAEQNFPRTEQAILLTGWLPKAAVFKLEQHLREITGGRCVFQTDDPKELNGEEVPVLLKHPWPLRPFEMLVSAYGLPQYREFEPTVFVALSYLLMFGMMFGDVGDGAILAAVGLLALFRGASKQIRDIGLMLLFGGGSSVVFGAIYGSYFGIPSLKKYALWHDPLEGNTMHLLYASIQIGVVMISLGLVLNMLNRFRRGDVVGACLDKFGLAGLLFYWGLLGLAMNYAVLQSHGLITAAFIVFFLLPLVGWTLKEPLELSLHHRAGGAAVAKQGLFTRLIESLVDVFEGIISYFSNTISFVRLAAYSMSHAALLMAAFTVAADLRHISPGGGLLSLLMIILGNLVALILEGIVASVQALRLEYYEFFGKFFSGSGQPFKPFRLLDENQVETSKAVFWNHKQTIKEIYETKKT